MAPVTLTLHSFFFLNLTTGEILSSLFFLFILYAEIHYRWPGFTGKLYKKEPEILFDLPFRHVMKQNVPLFLFVKDAHLFPVYLEFADILIVCEGQEEKIPLKFSIAQEINDRFYNQTFQLPASVFPRPGTYLVNVTLHYQVDGKRKQLRQDNYAGLSHKPFSIYISATDLPQLPGLQWGDLHVHSNYTNDQIEFAAPIRETAICAKAVGLNFLAITDHSYDMDDFPDDYTRNDPALQKWQQFQAEITELNGKSTDFAILRGEEVSVGNQKKQNVHCLILGNKNFYPGSGDGGDNPLNNRPTLTLPELIAKAKAHDPQCIIAAAHPFDQPPKSQQLLLNRGFWHPPDLFLPGLDYWQILNGRIDSFFRNGYAAWKKALLLGQEIGILGGTDAHGNFNCFRQISIPFLKMVQHREQLLGQSRSGIFSQQPLTEKGLLEKLRKKQVIVSNGPAANIQIRQNDKIYEIGSSISENTPFELIVHAASTPEFGALKKIICFEGNYETQLEKEHFFVIQDNIFESKVSLSFPQGLAAGYLRLSVTTEKGEGTIFCLTNPVWIKRHDSELDNAVKIT